jgi:hypothetical protein
MTMMTASASEGTIDRSRKEGDDADGADDAEDDDAEDDKCEPEEGCYEEPYQLMTRKDKVFGSVAGSSFSSASSWV